MTTRLLPFGTMASTHFYIPLLVGNRVIITLELHRLMKQKAV